MRSGGINDVKVFTNFPIRQHLRNSELPKTFQTLGKYNFKLLNCLTGDPAYPRVLHCM